MNINQCITLLDSIAKLQAGYKDYYLTRYCIPLLLFYLRKAIKQETTTISAPDIYTVADQMGEDYRYIMIAHEILCESEIIIDAGDISQLAYAPSRRRIKLIGI
ncbi:hypothetical protein LCGC14_1117150 [marine sediment metagenome]|uniref:Uncharacterized protein n=1 Tax=marine sediment metagenome TaxID=412755 RepID=A0A0F9M9T8_9ZZZZ